MFNFDLLSMTFVLLILLGSLPNIFYSQGYLSHIKRKGLYLINYYGFIGSMIGVVIANTAGSFLFFWEMMSITSWLLILSDTVTHTTYKAARFYFFMTHLGYLFLMLFFMIATNATLSMPFSEMHEVVVHFKYPSLLFLFISLGFLSKAGAVPLHVWLPYAHPEAPSPVSALMSGVMLKVAIYGLFRILFTVLTPWPVEWGITILIIGAVSALVGVLYALSEHDIKALLANHSIENIGIILIAFGMGMIFGTLGLHTLSTFAFIAAIFHSFNHMSFKSLLFMGAGSVLHETHTKNIEKYGGLIKTMPVTALTFLLASISISALPPTNGFLSEWMVFQSLLGSFHIGAISLKLAIPFAIFALALTGGLAIACFVKAFGITFLGLHRSENAQHATEVNSLMRFGMIMMSLVVISLMAVTPLYIKIFDNTLVTLGNPSVYNSMFQTGFLSIHSVGIDGGVVSPLILLFALFFVTLFAYLIFTSLKIKERVCHTWGCGYDTAPNLQYSATGFAGPIRRFFEWLYRPQEHSEEQTVQGHKTKFHYKSYEVHIAPLFENSLYKSVKKGATWVSNFFYRMALYETKHYAAMIFILMLVILFAHRIIVEGFNLQATLIEIITLTILAKILIKGDK